MYAQGHIDIPTGGDYFTNLARAIVGQQISVKAAQAIFARFEETTKLDLVRTALMSEADSKYIGLSGQKTSYLKNLAEHFTQDAAVFQHLDTLRDDEVIAELTKVKGIGVWSAQMFLLFTLGRDDVFAADDRGLQVAAERLYERTFTRKELTTFAEQWEPHRSAASMHLWQSLQNTPA